MANPFPKANRSITFALLFFLSVFLWAPSANAQNALDFDGANDVVQTTYSGVLGSANRTFEAWVYVSLNAPASNMAVVDYGLNAVGSRNTFSVNANDLNLRFISGGTNANISSSTNVITLAQWTHVAFVLDNGTGFLYVNGVQVGTGNLSTVNTPTGNANMTIGQRVAGGSIPFEGGIDEVRIWNVARTAAELMANMNNEICQHPNLMAYYKLNEGVAGGNNAGITTTTDHSGNGNPGTLSGFNLSGTTSNWISGVNLASSGVGIQLVNQTNVDCFGDSTGAATVMSLGGTPPLTYSWDTGDTTTTATNLLAGTYNVTVADSQQCTSELTITITQNPAITSSTTTTNIACFGDSAGSAHLMAGGGVGSLTYLWSNGATTDTVGGLTSGTYTVTITDSLGCQVLDSVIINDLFDSLFVAVDTIIDVTCQGGDDGQVNVQAQGGTLPYAFQWNDPNNQPFAQATNLEQGLYEVIVTDGNGCTATTLASVGFQNTNPTVDLGPDVVTSQNSATLTAPTGLATYTWSTGAMTASITVIQSGTYTVTVTDDNGCTGMDEIEVTLNDPGTSVGQLQQRMGVSLFPNPTTEKVTLVVHSPQSRYVLVNVAGQQLATGSLNGVTQKDVNVEHLPTGLYYFQVVGEDGAFQVLKVAKR